jgi:RNA polymerase sigma-70 factor, ECF subfamily
MGDVEPLLERYGDGVYRLALRITGGEDDAAAVVEETLQAAARTIHTATDKPAFGAWIYRTAGKAAYRRLRARRPQAREIMFDDVVPPLDGARHFDSGDDWSARIDAGAMQGALRTVLTEAIDGLPADYRTALVLQDAEGASKLDIAEILGIDVPGVSSRVHHARLFVRQRLSEYFRASVPCERE